MSKIKIVVDSSPSNPRLDFDCLGFMLTKNYIENKFFNKAKDVLLSKDYESVLEHKRDAREIKKIIQKTNQFLIFDLYRYEHGNVIFKVADSNPFNCQFDSGLCGWVVVAKNDVRKEFSCTRISQKLNDKIKKVINGEMEQYTNYCNGEVYGFQYIDSEGDEDSCYGFFGYDFETNGILDYIPEEFHKALKDNNFPIDQWLDIHGNEVEDEELEDELMYA